MMNVANLYGNPSSSAQHLSTYTKLFFFLKGQRTVIESIYTNLNNDLGTINKLLNQTIEGNTKQEKMSKLNKSERKIIKKLKKFLKLLKNDFLEANFRTNIFGASNFILKTKHINFHEKKHHKHCKNDQIIDIHFQINNARNDLTKAVNIFTNSCISFVKFPSMLLSNFSHKRHHDFTENQESIPLKAMSYVNDDNDNTVVCRLCNEKINISLFEEHIKSCAIAFKSENKIIEINNAIDSHMKKISKFFLVDSWPGDQDETVTVIFPMVHLIFLLHQARSIYSTGENLTYDSIIELDNIEESIFQIPILQLHQPYMKEAIRLLREKAKPILALYSASSILSTSHSINNLARQTTNINDFDFIKLISSGAYARVFLAKMRSTGDIFAIKVTPKSSVTHKNEVIRILTEKDIMLQYNSPYIVNFCMYYLIFFIVFIIILKIIINTMIIFFQKTIANI